MKLVESHLTIHEALQQSVSGIMDAMEAMPDKYPCSGEEAAALPSLFFRENEITYRVFYRDLKRMAEMGLEELPVAAIALPKGPDDPDAVGVVLSTDADTGRIPVTHDYSRRLSAYFPVAFVAALYELQSLMTKADIQGYVIGGMPRDLLQFEEKRLAIRDVDISVEGNAL